MFLAHFNNTFQLLLFVYFDIQELENELASIVDRHQNELTALQDAHRKTLTSLKQGHSSALEQLQKQLEEHKQTSSAG